MFLDLVLAQQIADVAEGEHRGYEELPGGVVHRRKIVLVKGGFCAVVDDLVGSGEHRLDVRFQLAPMPLTIGGDGWATAGEADGPRLFVRAFSTTPIEVNLAEGAADPHRGWVSGDYGRLTAIPGRPPDLIAKKGKPPWSEALVLTDDIQAFLICHPPGQPNDTHYHHHDEWWVVLRGEIDWYIEGQAAPIHARAGDFVFGPKHLWHHLEPVGHEPSVRIAINARGEFHRYDRPGCKPLG